MNRSKIVELFSKLNLNVFLITFLEEGYEIVFKARSKVNFDYISNIKIKGFSVVNFYERRAGIYTMLIVPTSMEEMTDYMWRYVEKFGDKDEKLINILGDAVCSLEKAISEIPDGTEEKEKAICNFNKFTSQIF